MSLLAFLLVTQTSKPVASIKLMGTSAVVGQPIKGVLTVTLPEGQHGYQNPPAGEDEIPIKLSVLAPGFKLTKVDYPKGQTMKPLGADKPTLVYEGTIKISFTLVASKPSANASVGFKFDYQLCTMQSCYPPNSITLKTPLKVRAKS